MPAVSLGKPELNAMVLPSPEFTEFRLVLPGKNPGSSVSPDFALQIHLKT